VIARCVLATVLVPASALAEPQIVDDRPVEVAGITDAVQLVGDAVELVGSSVHHCARRKTGRIACWGYIGLLGDGRNQARSRGN
jgi:hypothetical protein